MLEEITEKFTDKQEKAVEKAVDVIIAVLTKSSGYIKKNLLRVLGIFPKNGAHMLDCILVNSDVVDFDDANEVATSLHNDELRTEVLRRLRNRGFFKKEDDKRKADKMNKVNEVREVYSSLQLVTVFMAREQIQWLVKRIILFNEQLDASVITVFIKSFAILDDNRVDQIIDCLKNGECRMKLVKIISNKKFI
ncbi:hypothetical protein J7J83_00370 [bacterium]|nr:hypothetical protein [bacterium]